tara:strand:+ start:1008 stop:1184 length:177 start_codon:yes stop_codon:yes gene_type:complete
MEGYISDLTDSSFEYSDDEKLNDKDIDKSIIELDKLLDKELIIYNNYLKIIFKLINKN